VAQACCGHGVAERAYVVVSAGCQPWQLVPHLKDALTLRAGEALSYFAERGVGPDAPGHDAVVASAS
jgi:hypothetical protein